VTERRPPDSSHHHSQRRTSSLPTTSSKILLHPNASPGKSRSQPRRTASLHPKDFINEFSLLQELAADRDLYTASDEPPFKISFFPFYLKTSLDRARTYLQSQGVKVGISPIAACSIANGLRIISEDPNIRSLIKMRQVLNAVTDVAADELDEVLLFLHYFPLTTPDSSSFTQKRFQVRLPKELRGRVGETAESLGVSASVLAVLAITMTLAEETSTLEERKKEMETYMERLWKRADIRRAVVETWMGKLGIKIPTRRGGS
jgi:hypothetical protein